MAVIARRRVIERNRPTLCSWFYVLSLCVSSKTVILVHLWKSQIHRSRSRYIVHYLAFCSHLRFSQIATLWIGNRGNHQRHAHPSPTPCRWSSVFEVFHQGNLDENPQFTCRSLARPKISRGMSWFELRVANASPPDGFCNKSLTAVFPSTSACLQ